VERAAFAKSALHPYPAAMPLDYLPAYCQTDAGAREILFAVKPLEYHEYLLGVLRIDPDSVMRHAEMPEAIVSYGGNLNARRIRAAKLERVRQQVLKDLCELSRVCRENRKWLRRNHTSRSA
jgi:hypothetical protein